MTGELIRPESRIHRHHPSAHLVGRYLRVPGRGSEGGSIVPPEVTYHPKWLPRPGISGVIMGLTRGRWPRPRRSPGPGAGERRG